MSIASRRSAQANGHWRASAGKLAGAAGSIITALASAVSLWLGEHRRAQAQARTYERLSRMTDADLARRGIRRDGIPQWIRDHAD